MTHPDRDRLGGIGWLERTRGQLTREEQRRLVAVMLRTQVELLQGRVRRLMNRRPGTADLPGLPEPPDSALARVAEAVCLDELPPALAAHSWRTWWYGQLLAGRDGQRPDPELAHVAALMHDIGLSAPVAGEDFTLRSAGRARQLMEQQGVSADDIEAVRDAISVHTLPGLSLQRDGLLGTYLQAGALLDLIALRAADLPAAAIRQVTERHPRGDLVPVLGRAVRAEADAVPDGRFALINHWGFMLAVRVARWT